MSGDTGVLTHFDDAQFQLAYPDGIEFHYWQLSRNWIIRHVLQKYLAQQPLKILEIGCGRGIVVADLRMHEIDCDGVELALAPVLRQATPYVRTGIKAEEIEAERREKYNTLLLLDVIEHLEEPIDWLKNLLDYFPEVRQILITVPARKELWTNYDEFYGHFRRYDLDNLDKFTRGLDWQVGYASYFFHSLYLVMFGLSVFKRTRSVQYFPPDGFYKKLHKLFAGILIAEYSLLNRKIPGTSLIACLIQNKIT